MFEKEAEKYVKSNLSNEMNPKYIYDVNRAFQEGATYGYQKGFESGIKSSQANAHGKANEWHDLRKDPNDLPKENCKVHLYAKDKEYYMGFFA